jgi:hypothetical protein
VSRFPQTFCSQCGASLGPGDEGASHCDQHRAPATKVQREASGWSMDSDLAALSPMVAHEGQEPVPSWWKAVEAHLDEEAFYTAEEIAAFKEGVR